MISALFCLEIRFPVPDARLPERILHTLADTVRTHWNESAYLAPAAPEEPINLDALLTACAEIDWTAAGTAEEDAPTDLKTAFGFSPTSERPATLWLTRRPGCLEAAVTTTGGAWIICRAEQDYERVRTAFSGDDQRWEDRLDWFQEWIGDDVTGTERYQQMEDEHVEMVSRHFEALAFAIAALAPNDGVVLLKGSPSLYVRSPDIRIEAFERFRQNPPD